MIMSTDKRLPDLSTTDQATARKMLLENFHWYRSALDSAGSKSDPYTPGRIQFTIYPQLKAESELSKHSYTLLGATTSRSAYDERGGSSTSTKGQLELPHSFSVQGLDFIADLLYKAGLDQRLYHRKTLSATRGDGISIDLPMLYVDWSNKNSYAHSYDNASLVIPESSIEYSPHYPADVIRQFSGDAQKPPASGEPAARVADVVRAGFAAAPSAEQKR